MVRIALDIQNSAPRDPLTPPAATVLSSYTQALDTVRMPPFTSLCITGLKAHPEQIRLAETFLGIAESLTKPRGSLLR
jgi:hypothetical protein